MTLRFTADLLSIPNMYTLYQFSWSLQFLMPKPSFGRKNDQTPGWNAVVMRGAQPDFYNYNTLVIVSVSQLYFVPAF